MSKLHSCYFSASHLQFWTTCFGSWHIFQCYQQQLWSSASLFGSYFRTTQVKRPFMDFLAISSLSLKITSHRWGIWFSMRSFSEHSTLQACWMTTAAKEFRRKNYLSVVRWQSKWTKWSRSKSNCMESAAARLSSRFQMKAQVSRLQTTSGTKKRLLRLKSTNLIHQTVKTVKILVMKAHRNWMIKILTRTVHLLPLTL